MAARMSRLSTSRASPITPNALAARAPIPVSAVNQPRKSDHLFSNSRPSSDERWRPPTGRASPINPEPGRRCL